MKALVGAFNQEKALVGAFSVIVKTDGSFAALIKVLWDNVEKGREHNFEKKSIDHVNQICPYDVCSRLHYPATWFAKVLQTIDIVSD